MKKEGIVNIEEMKKALYGKNPKEAYNILLELEKISETNDFLYKYLNDFLEMLDNENTYIRIRGYRLYCKQAKWDKLNKINKMVDKILLQIVKEEKPIALRQKIKALEDIITNKTELRNKVKQKLLEIDCLKYQESMRGLIEKDIKNLLKIIDLFDNSINLYYFQS